MTADDLEAADADLAAGRTRPLEDVMTEIEQQEQEQDAPFVAPEPPPDDDEQEDDEQEQEQEHDDDATPPPRLGEIDYERIIAACEKYTQTYQRTIADKLGPWFGEFVPCVMCEPWAPGLVQQAMIGKFPGPQVQAITQMVQGFGAKEYKQDPETSTCPVCGGEGFTSTGSRRDGYQNRTCKACHGAGFIDHSPITNQARVNGDVPPITAPPTQPDMALPEVDGWGIARWLPDGRENPNWGRPPNLWNHEYPVGGVVAAAAGIGA